MSYSYAYLSISAHDDSLFVRSNRYALRRLRWRYGSAVSAVRWAYLVLAVGFCLFVLLTTSAWGLPNGDAPSAKSSVLENSLGIRGNSFDRSRPCASLCFLNLFTLVDYLSHRSPIAVFRLTLFSFSSFPTSSSSTVSLLLSLLASSVSSWM